MSKKRELWETWLDRTLLEDIRSLQRPDPVSVFTSISGEFNTSDEFDEYRYGRGEGDYLYMLYFLGQDSPEPSDIFPMYIGETNDITSRLYQHFKKIQAAPSIEDWTGDGSWGSWSKYDHMAAICERASSPLYVWILDVESLDPGPYGYPTYRQELEAKLVGLAHAQPRFAREFANREFVPNRVVHEMGKAGPEWLSGDVDTYEPTLLSETATSHAGDTKTDLWHEWVNAVLLSDIQSDTDADPIPLFETTQDLQVQLREKGGLKRSDAIDARIRREGRKCVHETGVTDDGPDGLLYVLYQLDTQDQPLEVTDIIPRYIGKAGIELQFTIKSTENELGVGLVIQDDAEMYWQLAEEREEINSQFDQELIWEEPEETRSGNERSKIVVKKHADVTDEEQWNGYLEWMLRNGERFHEVFYDRLQQL